MIGVARIQAWSFRCPTPKPVATSFWNYVRPSRSAGAD